MPEPVQELFPLIWTNDVDRLADWCLAVLDLKESWRASGDTGVVEHAELHGFGGKVSINIKADRRVGPSGVALRIDDEAQVRSAYERAEAAGASITQALAHSVIAYGFTVTDPDGNEWWVHAETGMLDELRR